MARLSLASFTTPSRGGNTCSAPSPPLNITYTHTHTHTHMVNQQLLLAHQVVSEEVSGKGERSRSHVHQYLQLRLKHH